MNANEFVGLLFLGRDVAHSVHLNTRSFAKHSALNGFYDGVVGLADTFAETYQGRHGLIGQIKLQSVKQKGALGARAILYGLLNMAQRTGNVLHPLGAGSSAPTARSITPEWHGLTAEMETTAFVCAGLYIVFVY